jgi:hypothetical protein
MQAKTAAEKNLQGEKKNGNNTYSGTHASFQRDNQAAALKTCLSGPDKLVPTSTSSTSSTENTIVAALTMDLDWFIVILGSTTKHLYRSSWKTVWDKRFTLESHNEDLVCTRG